MTKVLLYSGGFDSYCLAWLWQPDVLLYVDMGTRYAAQERRRLPDTATVVSLPLVAWERPDGIIPLRNLFLVCVGAQYGERVALAATAGDRVLDKSYEFARQAGELLTYLWQPQHWTGGRTIQVELPVKRLTKAALAREAVEVGGCDPEWLATRTFSCYTPTTSGTECGACKPCTRKWIALRANGYPATVDASAYVRANYLPPILSGTWDRGDAEREDVLSALGDHP